MLLKYLRYLRCIQANSMQQFIPLTLRFSRPHIPLFLSLLLLSLRHVYIDTLIGQCKPRHLSHIQQRLLALLFFFARYSTHLLSQRGHSPFEEHPGRLLIRPRQTSHQKASLSVTRMIIIGA